MADWDDRPPTLRNYDAWKLASDREAECDPADWRAASQPCAGNCGARVPFRVRFCGQCERIVKG